MAHEGSAFRGGFHAFAKAALNDLPLPLGFDRLEERAQLAELAQEMIRLHGRRVHTRTPGERESLERAIRSHDQKIASAVFDLYRLSPEERSRILAYGSAIEGAPKAG